MIDKCSDKVVSSKSEEISTIVKIGEIISVPTKTDDNIPKKTVDLKNITSLDNLKSIHKQDPFMYYSIPEVHRATVLMQDIDLTNILGGAPAQEAQDETPHASQKVSRSTRISFECHPDLLFESM